MKREKSEQNSISTLLRVAGFIKPFKYLLILQIILNAIFSALSTISVTLILPILEIIFGSKSGQVKAAPTGNPLKDWSNSFFDGIYSLINSQDPYQSLLNISYLIIAVFILKNIFKYFSSVTSTRLEENVIKSIRDLIFSKITSLSIDFFSRSKQGNLISTITNDVNSVNSTTLNSFTVFLREIIQVILFLFLLLSISVKLSLIAFSTSIISLILIRIAMKYLRRYASRMQTAMADYTSTLSETISGIRVVKGYNAEATANNRFFKDTLQYVKSAIKHKKIIELIPVFNEIFAIFALCVVLFVGGSEVLAGKMAPEKLMLFLFALFSIMSPIATVVNSVSRFQHGVVAAERLFVVLDEIPSVVSGIEKIDEIKSEIEVRDVSFAYINNPVLNSTNFIIPKNKKIAFVGSSGSGKSTMLDLIIRFYDPQSGNILIDGKDIKNLDVIDYRGLFGIVSQENMLFNDTIANNIRYGLENISDEELYNAAKKANAYNFIMKMPNGFNTQIGDRGVTLSGGERQRVAIARALVRNPQILVFDEATSALDAESEKIVQSAINDSMTGKTAIIVAHRLATIIDCDEILVFDSGVIKERGTHKELLDKKGIYAKLYEIQFKG
ncbi:MAG: ABC transporter ATP-binding protein [Candidatus Kapabacteria bacterium]|nr:ABC transporter ATP-binding protein [Ignavibacteriota bacterium]MCW5884701.1 ABC transporter ATP-binding protein [Candidatus Kapabacteria bacterium]